jgi:hypothetical protein
MGRFFSMAVRHALNWWRALLASRLMIGGFHSELVQGRDVGDISVFITVIGF